MLLRKIFGAAGIACVSFLLVACGPSDSAKPPTMEPPKACTQEAKVCPDGTAVSRTGPNCEFAACPGDGGAPPVITPTGK